MSPISRSAVKQSKSMPSGKAAFSDPRLAKKMKKKDTKVKHRKPTGFTFDYVTNGSKPQKYANDLESMGYKTRVIKDSGSWFVYRKKK